MTPRDRVANMGSLPDDDVLNGRPVLSALAAIKDSVDGLRADTNERLGRLEVGLERTNERLDLVVEGQVRTATEVVTLTGRVDVLTGRVDVLTGRVDVLTGEVRTTRKRFEHFLATEGDAIRDLKERMTRVESVLDLSSDSH